MNTLELDRLEKDCIKKFDLLVVGTGISGCSFAREYVNLNKEKKILMIEKKPHIGGLCNDYTNEDNLIIQQYGPHIFHTNNKEVWEYLSNFTKWNNYKHKVLAKYNSEFYPIPINRKTINKFFNINLKDTEEVKTYLEKIRIPKENLENSRDVVINKVGEELYNAFIKSYSKKQWGIDPKKLPKTILNRLPIRFTDDDYYFSSKYQGLPKNGFSKMMEKMITHPNITVMLNTDFRKIKKITNKKNKIIYTGRADEILGNKFGTLPYRKSIFNIKKINEKKYQPVGVVNYTQEKIETLRTTEFKKLYEQKCDYTMICFEKMSDKGEDTYPFPSEKGYELFEKYRKNIPENIHLLGRLGKHKYIDIDQSCWEALQLARNLK